MQTAVRHKTKSKRHYGNGITLNQADVVLNEFASMIEQAVTKNTHAGVKSLGVDMEPNRVTLTGFCDSFYIKQLAQQAIIDMILDREIVNDIDVI
jgi:hypothetical protein